MKFLVGIAKMLYWLVIACIPLLPICILDSYDSPQLCSDNGFCSQFGNVLNDQGVRIVFVTSCLIWPMCLWHIIFSRFSWVPQTLARWSSNRLMRLGAAAILRLYLVVVACIPVLFWYLFGTFRAPLECVAIGSCMQFYLPLDGKCIAVVVVVAGLLWPMCVRYLIGKQTENRVRK